MPKLLISLLFLFVTNASTVLGANKTHWRISSDHAKCLKANLPRYKEIKDDPIIILLNACPETNRLAAIQKIQKNSDPGIREKQDTGLDQIIIFNQSELACIDAKTFSEDAGKFLIPKKLICSK